MSFDSIGNTRLFGVASALVGLLPVLLGVASSGYAASSKPVDCVGANSCTFPETGKTVQGRFLNYWNDHGDLMQQGYPISDEIQETNDADGKVYTVQYFERAVFEYHTEHPAPYDVLLSQLGTLRYHEKYPDGAPDQQVTAAPSSRYFAETGMTVGGLFLDYWNDHGGLAQNGYPISEEFTETSDLDGKPYRVQYFERAVFEYHPENQPPYDVLLSQLGTFKYRSKYGLSTVTPTPISTPISQRSLNGVFMTSADEGWAVGDLGTIFHYTEGSWREVSSPVTHDLVRNLNSVYMTSPDEGWAVGTFSTIIHYVNGKWENASGQPGEHLNDVRMLTPSEGWAVGGGTGLRGDSSLHWWSVDT